MRARKYIAAWWIIVLSCLLVGGVAVRCRIDRRRLTPPQRTQPHHQVSLDRNYERFIFELEQIDEKAVRRIRQLERESITQIQRTAERCIAELKKRHRSGDERRLTNQRSIDGEIAAIQMERQRAIERVREMADTEIVKIDSFKKQILKAAEHIRETEKSEMEKIKQEMRRIW